MNQLCKVCGEPAAGYHFGAFTCEGCKSFFGRTYNNLSALGECKNNGECVINKKNRTSCKSCRLKKCLMVGMSKSGSRYGRRSNWFKIHCLIQDQQEMSNRIAEQGLTNNKNDDLASKLNDSKDFIMKFKENELKNSGNSGNSELNSRISPRLTSPNSSEGSIGRSVSSPYSALFEGAKVPNFANPYLPASNFSPADLQKEFNNLASRFNPAAALPLAPITPLSPLNAAVSRLFLQNTILGKRFNDFQKMQNEQLLSASRFLPFPNLNTVLKPSNKDVVDEMSNGMSDYYADVPEQEGPIDLSVKRMSDFRELSIASVTNCPKQVPGDQDSGFSPSSNEDNHHTSPLDLTSKRQCLMSMRNIGLSQHHRPHHHHSGGSGSNSSMIDVNRVENDDDDEDDVDDDEDTSDVEVHDEMDDEPQQPQTQTQQQSSPAEAPRCEIECKP